MKVAINSYARRSLLTGILALVHFSGGNASSAPALDREAIKSLPLPGDVFVIVGHTAFIIGAKTNPASKTKPWVWYAPTLPGLPGKEETWMFERFMDAGIAIAGIDVGESFGSPAGRKLFTSFYAEMTQSRGYSSKPVLLGRSRGGLMTLSWAADHPEKVAGFAGIYPVCNFASYPGIEKTSAAYEMSPRQLETLLEEQNPIDRLAPLAKAGVPFFAIHGDADMVVPLESNSGLMRDRYRAMGGSMELIIPTGQGHNMWPGFFQSQALVNFVKSHAGPNLTISSPLDYQVIQRRAKKGAMNILGEFNGFPANAVTVEARLIVDGHPLNWRRLSVAEDQRHFEACWDLPVGGWHRLEVRAICNGEVLAESIVDHVGVGEVFVIAGQSNSANHGAEKQNTTSGLVTAFDGNHWHPANDPQPGASGVGGSFIPPFGDAIAERFRVPVGVVACGVGATSVREWLPKGATFPNPPTLTANVEERPDGGWASKGAIFTNFVARMKEFGPGGFRAVLWHQGESDANQEDATRTLPGKLYRDYLEKLISESRREIGWNAPWFVAQASYHRPGDEASPEIRAAQASLWKDGIALEGPDTDAIKGDFRENGGKGVHFSGRGLREHAARWVDKVVPWLDKE